MAMTNFLRKYNDLLSYDKTHPHNSLGLLIFIVLYLYIESNMMISLSAHPQSIEKNLIIVSEFVMCSILFLGMIKRNLNDHDVRNLIELIENDLNFSRHEITVKLWTDIQKYRDEKRKYMGVMSKNLGAMFFVYGLLVNNRNIFNRIIGMTDRGSKESYEWPTPYFTYCPPELRSPLNFLFTYLLQTTLLAIFMVEAYFVITLVYLSSERIISDFEILHKLLRHITNVYPYAKCVESPLVKQHVYTRQTEMANLRKDMARVIQCHQILNRNFKVCVDGSGFMISVVNLVIMVYCCTMTYLMLTANNLKKILNFSMSLLLVSLSLFSIYHNGQRIFNQNDILRKNLAELPWTDKPQWFKKTLHMMLTRANVNIEMRPIGIYTLNYMTFKDWTKFVFSTGNVFYTKKLTS